MSNAVADGADFAVADRRWVAGGGALAYALLLIRTAWVCDDAYITFRTVANFLHGYGLRWNIANRVQAFTHPLWMFVMAGAAAITGDVYFTSIFLSIALSLAVVAIIAGRLASSLPTALAALSALAVSKSFVEYSTSGLENALTHLLLVVFFLACASTAAGKRRVLVLSLLTSLLILNRLDTGVLVLPALAAEVWRARQARPWLSLAVGMIPLIAWELFSLVYYGFPVPNTAYAKLGPGVPRIELIQQGLLYILDAIANDPITPLAILVAVVSPFILGCSWQIPAGMLIYLAYVVWAGGDFMSGRFLAAPFLCAVAHLSRQLVAPRLTFEWAAAIGLVWLVGLGGPRPTVLSGATFGDVNPDEAITVSHVNDERRFYYATTGLLTAHRGVSMPNHRWARLGEEHRRNHTRVWIIDEAGFIGYAAGPETRFIDTWGLADPLLARLPAEVPWQIGHFTRKIPVGYRETIESGRNVIQDAALAAYYERLRIITEEPLWSRRRLRTILWMNLGRYDPLVSSYGLVSRSLDDLAVPRGEGTPWNASGNLVLTSQGASIAVDGVHTGGRIELSVSGNDAYRLRFLRDGRRVAERLIRQPLGDDGSLRVHTLVVPQGVQWNGILLVPVEGDSRYSIGHLRLLP